MNTNSQQSKQRKTLEYIVEDFLEMKGCVNEERSSALRHYLLSQQRGVCHVTSVEGFYWGRHLVLLDKIDPRYFDHLICVTPGNGRIQVRVLPETHTCSS